MLTSEKEGLENQIKEKDKEAEQLSKLENEKNSLQEDNAKLIKEISTLKTEFDNKHKELEMQKNVNEKLNKLLDEKNLNLMELNNFFIQLQQILEKESQNDEDNIDEILNLEQKEEIDSLYKLIAQCKDALLSLQSKKEQENK